MKKNKSCIFFFFFFLLKISLSAQYCDTLSFQKIFWNQGIQNARPKNMFFSPAGDIYIIGSTESAINYSEDIWIMKTTPGGNVIWSKTIGMQKDETINGIKYTSDGGFIIAGTTNSVSTFTQGWIVKTDSNGVVQWSEVLGTQYSNITQISELNDGSYGVSGVLYTDFSGDSTGKIKSVKKSTNVVLKLDKEGNTIWWRSFRFYNTEGLKTISQLKDSTLIITGVADSINDRYIIKLNQNNGNVIWMNEYKSFNRYSFPHPIEQADKTIHLHVGNSTFFLTADGKFFDGRQIELNSTTLNLDNVQVADIGLISPGAEMYDANLYPQHSPIVFTVKDDSVVIWAHEYEQTPDKLQRLINGRIYKSSIYIAGSYVTDNLSDNNAGENLTYLIKADANGSTLCSDTFNISFKIDVIPYPADMAHSWIDEGSLQPHFVSPYTEVLTGKMSDDCTIQNCCKAVIADTTISICNGNFYKLPPNDSLVTTSGLYKFNYYTFGGCDSILNYNVNFKNLYAFSLGDDTCLINNQPVTFSLPVDSNIIYKWQDGSSSNNFIATVPGKYWVTATSSCNILRDTVVVNAVCSLPVYVPSAFTPNEDGLNDVFKIPALNGQRLIALSIYNRYGQNIFFSENNSGWNGTFNGIKQPPGTYIYIVRYFDLEGTSHTLKGTIVLIR